MIIQIRIESQLKSKMDILVQKGAYADLSTLATVAIENLVVAEEEHATGTSRHLLVPEQQQPGATQPIVDKENRPQSIQPEPYKLSDGAYHACFGWKGTPTAAKKTARPLPDDRFGPTDRVPLERWIFGQQNRIVPLKLNSRLLLQVHLNETTTPWLADVASEVSRLASLAHTALDAVDKRLNHKKEDLLTTALPVPGSEKAQLRYADQFVAAENTKGELSGLLIDWKLASIERKKGKALLYPTEACVAFADLESPLFDSAPIESFKSKFSSEEIEWALAHISRHVRVEDFAFETILNGVANGAKEPNSLDRHLREIGVVEDKKTSDDFVATQRTGALSRMADLELVRRVRDGVRISYEVTGRGMTWLSSRSN